jgi:hypothetical protein
LKKAFSGADVIFGVTDFWGIWGSVPADKKALPELELLKWVGEKEEQQGRNLADAAASVPGLHRYIFSSMASAAESSGGKYSQVFHMDSKARAVKYAQGLAGLKDKFSQIQAPIYFNLIWQWNLPTTPKKASLHRRAYSKHHADITQQPDGTWRIKAPGPGNKGVPLGDVRQDLGKCVKAVAEGKPNMNFFAIGDKPTWEELLRTFCETQNLPYGGYDGLTYEEITKLMPGGLGHEFGLNVLFAFDFGYEGTDPNIVTPDMVSFASPMRIV